MKNNCYSILFLVSVVSTSTSSDRQISLKTSTMVTSGLALLGVYAWQVGTQSTIVNNVLSPWTSVPLSDQKNSFLAALAQPIKNNLATLAMAGVVGAGLGAVLWKLLLSKSISDSNENQNLKKINPIVSQESINDIAKEKEKMFNEDVDNGEDSSDITLQTNQSPAEINEEVSQKSLKKELNNHSFGYPYKDDRDQSTEQIAQEVPENSNHSISNANDQRYKEKLLKVKGPSLELVSEKVNSIANNLELIDNNRENVVKNITYMQSQIRALPYVSFQDAVKFIFFLQTIKDQSKDKYKNNTIKIDEYNKIEYTVRNLLSYFNNKIGREHAVQSNSFENILLIQNAAKNIPLIKKNNISADGKNKLIRQSKTPIQYIVSASSIKDMMKYFKLKKTNLFRVSHNTSQSLLSIILEYKSIQLAEQYLEYVNTSYDEHQFINSGNSITLHSSSQYTMQESFALITSLDCQYLIDNINKDGMYDVSKKVVQLIINDISSEKKLLYQETKSSLAYLICAMIKHNKSKDTEGEPFTIINPAIADAIDDSDFALIVQSYVTFLRSKLTYIIHYFGAISQDDLSTLVDNYNSLSLIMKAIEPSKSLYESLSHFGIFSEVNFTVISKKLNISQP